MPHYLLHSSGYCISPLQPIPHFPWPAGLAADLDTIQQFVSSWAPGSHQTPGLLVSALDLLLILPVVEKSPRSHRLSSVKFLGHPTERSPDGIESQILA